MLRWIIQPPRALVTFLLAVGLQWHLNRPQWKHIERLLVAMVVMEGRRTLWRMRAVWAHGPDGYAVADFLRQSPWDEQAVEQRRRAWVVQELTRWAGDAQSPVVLAVVDDTTVWKDNDGWRDSIVDWLWDRKTQ